MIIIICTHFIKKKMYDIGNIINVMENNLKIERNFFF